MGPGGGGEDWPRRGLARSAVTPMLRYLIAYASTLVVLLVVDFAWLSVMGKAFYKKALGDIMLESFRLGPALAFYVLYAGGVVYFAVLPAVASGAWTTALLHGGLLGLIAYGTYDLTNMASLRNWTIQLAAVDMAWGAALTAGAASVGAVVMGAMTR